MLSSMGYWVSHRLNKIADSSGWNSADAVTDIVNSRTASRENRNQNLVDIKLILK